jgi:predicted RNase H-like HicB family nuclease
MKIRLTKEIWKEGNMYVSYCPELDIASCGEDIHQAKKNLIEAILINIEETKKMGTLEEILEEAGFTSLDKRRQKWIPPTLICTERMELKIGAGSLATGLL